MTFEGNRKIIRFNTTEAKYLVGPAILPFLADLAGIRFSQTGLYSLGISDAADEEDEYSAWIADDEWVTEKVWISTAAEGKFKGTFHALDHGIDRSYRIDLYALKTQYDSPTPSTVEDSKLDDVDDVIEWHLRRAWKLGSDQAILQPLREDARKMV